MPGISGIFIETEFKNFWKKYPGEIGSTSQKALILSRFFNF